MNTLEIAIARYLQKLIQAEGKRELTPDERRFIQRMQPWIRKINQRELERG